MWSQRMEPSTRHTRHSGHTPECHAYMCYHAGMHWLREEGFQGLRARSVETGEQFTCPLCRQPVSFARKYETL